MLDIKFIRENAEAVQQNADNKSVEIDISQILELDKQVRNLSGALDELRAKRNELAAQSKGGKPTPEQIDAGKKLKTDIAEKETELEPVASAFTNLMKQVPNMALDYVPVGHSEDENQVILQWGEIPKFDFEPKNHWEIAEAKGWIDKERAAKVTGARFAYLKGHLVPLQFAIQQWVMRSLMDENTLDKILKLGGLDGVTNKPFNPVLPPHMIRTEMFDAMDRLEPKEERYKIEGHDLWLQGSAEHVLGSMHANEVLEAKDMPMRFIGFATSFRGEAGTYGKDMEGIIRMHQFDKLEMEILATPEQGLGEHQLTIAVQEYLLRELKLPYQKLQKCTYDIGKPNAAGVDMDVWLPGQNQYRETHTADYMTDFQTRRLKTRVKLEDGSLVYAYTIDATAFAVGRLMVGIMENYQQEDGSVLIPEVLRPYCGFDRMG